MCRRSGASWLWPVNLNAVTVPGLQGFFVSGAESVGLRWESALVAMTASRLKGREWREPGRSRGPAVSASWALWPSLMRAGVPRLAALTRSCAAGPYWWQCGRPAQATTCRVNVRSKGPRPPPVGSMSPTRDIGTGAMHVVRDTDRGAPSLDEHHRYASMGSRREGAHPCVRNAAARARETL